jgi:hypothetical protein
MSQNSESQTQHLYITEVSDKQTTMQRKAKGKGQGTEPKSLVSKASESKLHQELQKQRELLKDHPERLKRLDEIAQAANFGLSKLEINIDEVGE